MAIDDPSGTATYSLTPASYATYYDWGNVTPVGLPQDGLPDTVYPSRQAGSLRSISVIIRQLSGSNRWDWAVDGGVRRWLTAEAPTLKRTRCHGAWRRSRCGPGRSHRVLVRQYMARRIDGWAAGRARRPRSRRRNHRPRYCLRRAVRASSFASSALLSMTMGAMPRYQARCSGPSWAGSCGRARGSQPCAQRYHPTVSDSVYPSDTYRGPPTLRPSEGCRLPDTHDHHGPRPVSCGFWYPPRIVRKTTSFPDEQVSRFLLDFRAEIPDSLFKPVE